MAEAVVTHEGDGPSGHAKLLTEEQETVGLPVVIISRIVRETIAGGCQGTVVIPLGREIGEIAVIAVTEVNLRLEQYGCVLGELMVQTHSEPVAIGG